MADKEAAEAAKAAEKKKKAEVARAKAKAVAQTKKHGACGFDEESFHNVREGWEAIKEYLRELEVLFTVVGVKDKHDEKVTWEELVLRTVKHFKRAFKGPGFSKRVHDRIAEVAPTPGRSSEIWIRFLQDVVDHTIKCLPTAATLPKAK